MEDLQNQIDLNYQNSSISFNGSKLVKLVLDGVSIIQTDIEEGFENFLNSGCYLMYPWTGRLRSLQNLKGIMKMEEDEIKFPFKDNRGLPLHGFYQCSERNVFNLSDNTITFSPKQNTFIKTFPHFTEQFILNSKSLEIITTFTNDTNENQFFSYAYHPYLGINSFNKENSINEFEINSNINIHCLLTEELVPALNDNNEIKIENYELNQVIGEKFFDDLFYYNNNQQNMVNKENPFISIFCRKSNREVKISVDNSESLDDSTEKLKLNYFQIYTPKNRNCIAIEPMTSPSNAFNIDFPNYLMRLAPNKKAEGKTTISVK